VTIVTYNARMRMGLGGVALVFSASLACGRLKPATSDGGSPMAPTPDTGTAPEAAPPDTSADVGIAPTGRPLPADVHPAVRLLGEGAILMGNGKSACTHQTPASGDGHRWCAVTIGAAHDGLADLWVIDVTRAAAGDVPPCDGTSTGCLHLTDKVVTHSATFFDGDSLFYGTDSTASGDFLGRIYAWRPGWSAGRQVSSDAGFTCAGNIHAPAAVCLDDPAGDPAKRDSANVRAGYLVDQTGGALPSFGRFPLRNDNDTAWQAGLSPDGTIFALSNADAIGAKETLRIAPTGQIGQAAPTLTLDDVDYWQIANDGQKIYFLRGLPVRADLYVADFPSGANVTLIETGILSFALLGDRTADQAVELQKDLAGGGGAVELVADHTATTPKRLFTYSDFLNGAIVSPDLRYTTWLDESFRGTVFRNADLAPCSLSLTDEPPVSEPSYLEGGSLMFWKAISVTDAPLREAFFAPPEHCRQRQRFGRGVDLLAPVANRGVVFTDEINPAGTRATLKYIAAAPDGTALDPAGAVRVQENVAQPVVLVGAAPPLLVYRAAGASADTTGLFVFGPVPF
jgi:hypothetical protein